MKVFELSFEPHCSPFDMGQEVRTIKEKGRTIIFDPPAKVSGFSINSERELFYITYENEPEIIEDED